jgi:protein-S-isoprenylcysteine O-methyltransferase Ste14
LALALLPSLLALVQAGVILREERYLERRFGDEYRRYRASVRRWL